MKIFFKIKKEPTSWYATYEGIAGKYRRTAADWIVIQYLATSGNTARTETGITAFRVDASFV